MKIKAEAYLENHCILNGLGNIDGTFVSLKTAMIAIEKVISKEKKYYGMSWVSTDKERIPKSIRKAKDNIENYLTENSVLDGRGDMIGQFLPLSIAMITINLVIEGKATYSGIDWKSNFQ